MKKKLITLAKELDFKTEHEYYDYMIETHINGQFTQCRNLFDAMKKEDQKSFLVYTRSNIDESRDVYSFYFNLL